MPPTPPKQSSFASTILIAALLVAIVGSISWFATRQGDSGDSPGAETSDPSPGTKPSPPAGSRDDSKVEGSARASGQVRSKSGTPLDRGRVTLLPLAREGESAEPIDVECDDSGAWTIASLAPGRYALSATAPDHLPAWRPELEVEPGATLAELDFVLEPGGSSLAGTVHDRSGGEIEAARIRLTPVGGLSRLRERESFFTLTDAEGRYALQVPEGRFRVEASHPDYTREQAVLDLGGGRRTRDFSLVPMGVIEGVVVRASDRSPVAGASLTWSRERTQSMPGGERSTRLERGGTITTDEAGQFRIRGLLPGTLLISARAPGLASDAPTPVPIAIAEHVEGVEILLGQAADLRGRVVASDDAKLGIAGAEIDLSSPTGPSVSATADAEGHFVIHGVQPGGYELFASAEGWLPRFPPTRISVALDQPNEVSIALERGQAIRGRVEPATRAEITIDLKPGKVEFGGSGMGMMMSSSASATSEPDQGSFVLAPLAPGSYTLVAKAADGRGGSVEVEVGPSGADDIVIVLEPRAKLSGVVRDSQGKPVAGASVIARKREPSNASVRVVVDGRELTASQAPTSDEGRYELLGLDAGGWTIEVVDAQGDALAWADGSRKALELELREAEQREGFDLDVEARDGTITGTVRDAEGQPVADAWVSALFTPGMPEPEPEPEGESRSEMVMVMATDAGMPSSDLPPTLTDAEGRFRFGGLRRGPHRLVAESTSAGGVAKVTLDDVIPDADVILELAPLATIEGKVTGDSNEDCIARDCIVRLSGPTSRSGKVHEGSFELARLDPGHYSLDVETKTGGAHVEVDVEAGERVSVELAIQRFARVRGRILDDQDKPVIGAEIMIGDSPEEGMVMISQDGSKEPIVTDAEGRFDLAVAPGARVLLAVDMKSPRPLAVQRFTVESGKDVELGDLHPPEGGAGSGAGSGSMVVEED